VAADPEHQGTPVIMLSAGDSIEEKVRCLSAGASDYAAKDIHPSELVARARVHLQLKTLRDELEKKNEELALIARIDPLTGIANRLRFMEGLAQESNRTSREGGSMAVCMVDIDHFKQVNDRYGHPAGDKVLCEVARRLESSVRIFSSPKSTSGSHTPTWSITMCRRCER